MRCKRSLLRSCGVVLVMEVGPPAPPCRGVPNDRKLLHLSAVCELRKGARDESGVVWRGRVHGSAPLMKLRKRGGVIETGVQSLPRDASGACLSSGQLVTGVQVAVKIGRQHGTREPVAPAVLVGVGPAGRGSTPSSGNCERRSTGAGHGDGPSRVEVMPAMRAKRRGRVALSICWSTGLSGMSQASGPTLSDKPLRTD